MTKGVNRLGTISALKQRLERCPSLESLVLLFDHFLQQTEALAVRLRLEQQLEGQVGVRHQHLHLLVVARLNQLQLRPHLLRQLLEVYHVLPSRCTVVRLDVGQEELLNLLLCLGLDHEQPLMTELLPQVHYTPVPSNPGGHIHLAINQRDLQAHILIYMDLHCHHRLYQFRQPGLRLRVILLGICVHHLLRLHLQIRRAVPPHRRI
mmetsp:Transcript_22742/g.49829  ORF Transcript_22742/g.49829 Transcript_22742/m.49829 type:complete len:207 (+) Transcript_22742:195-815(+)